MAFNVKTELTDVNYELVFKEAWIEGAIEKNRLSIVKQFLKSFQLRLNDIKFNDTTLSEKYIFFSRFYGETFLNVNFGLEQIYVTVKRNQSQEKLKKLLTNIYDIVRSKTFISQRIILNQHMIAEKNVNEYLETLNPNTPDEIKGFTTGRGVSYRMADKDKKMEMSVVVTNSAMLENGIYFNFDCQFMPNPYDIETASELIKAKYDLITKALNLEID